MQFNVFDGSIRDENFTVGDDKRVLLAFGSTTNLVCIGLSILKDQTSEDEFSAQLLWILSFRWRFVDLCLNDLFGLVDFLKVEYGKCLRSVI